MPVQKPGRSKQDYGTPMPFLTAVLTLLRIPEFVLDIAAESHNAKARAWITPVQDALRVRDWRAHALTPFKHQLPEDQQWFWLNPPYEDLRAWVGAAKDQHYRWGSNIVVLVPASVGSNWWASEVHRHCMVRFVRPRLTFDGCEDPYPKDCALLCYGYGHAIGYQLWNWQTGARS